MTAPFPNWITKQMIRGISGFNLDAYLMALEGWRRGLTLTWYLDPKDVTDLKIIGFNPLGKSFSLEDEETDKIHYFYRSRGDLVANEAVDTVHDKFKTKQILLDAGVSTTKGITFHREEEIDKVISRFKKEAINYPVVVKPVFGSLGKGVITNIRNENELQKIVNETKENKNYSQFIIEEHIKGKEYRVYVVGNEVVAATERLPAHVIGDGKHTIEQLIKKKNEQRRENPYLKTKLINIDKTIENFIERKGYALKSIPNVNEHVPLKGASNIAAGGDPVDATTNLPESVRRSAVEAIKSIPYLNHAGVDVILNKNNQAYTIEINATADISMHIFPQLGVPRNVPEKIIDYYFSESVSQFNNDIYFDYKKVLNMFESMLAKEMTLRNIPIQKLIKKRFIIKGKVQKVGYRRWVRKKAVKNNIHGYIRNLKNGNVVVVAVSDNIVDLNEFKRLCSIGPRRAKVIEVKELSWNKPIKTGFEIRKSQK